MDYCRVTITQDLDGRVVVQAPLDDQALCLDVLRDAGAVVRAVQDLRAFTGLGRSLVIAVGMDGQVDLHAPMPPKDWCLNALTVARAIVERYDGHDRPITTHGIGLNTPSKQRLHEMAEGH